MRTASLAAATPMHHRRPLSRRAPAQQDGERVVDGGRGSGCRPAEPRIRGRRGTGAGMGARCVQPRMAGAGGPFARPRGCEPFRGRHGRRRRGRADPGGVLEFREPGPRPHRGRSGEYLARACLDLWAVDIFRHASSPAINWSSSGGAQVPGHALSRAGTNFVGSR